MLHEKINYLHVQKQLNLMGMIGTLKKFVDSLYSGQEKRNKVKLSYMENYDLDNDSFTGILLF